MAVPADAQQDCTGEVMSVWNTPSLTPSTTAPNSRSAEKVTIPSLIELKHTGSRIAAVTAYDFPSAQLADQARIDIVLVGDSLAMTVLGRVSTLAVTMDEMLVFTRAVRRGLTRALLVADMPFGSYQSDDRIGVDNALRFIKEAGAEAVKLEGARPTLARRLVDAEIPVMGHLGLTPQSVHRMGGYKVQAKSHDAIARLREDAQRLAEAGCFSLVLEGIPREVAATITAELPIPTIGIGAGPECDGQILVWHDLLGLSQRPPAKFVRPYLDGAALIRTALAQYVDDVQTQAFPADAESYHLPRARELVTA
jgi:3-methyl-2-oxobutanoate hydroxymethyltransferase